jgi:2'-5' RNA ligase
MPNKSEVQMPKEELEPVTGLNIVILPDEETSRRAMEISSAIANAVPVEFELDNINFRPHVTLYQGSYAEGNLAQLKESLSVIAETTQPLEISLDGAQAVLGTFVFWNAKNAEETGLQDLHEKTLGASNHLRQPISLEQVSFPGITDEHRQRIARDGGHLYKDRFIPHITITRLKDPKDATEAINIVNEAGSMKFSGKDICLAKLGPHGTISDIVERFPMRKS